MAVHVSIHDVTPAFAREIDVALTMAHRAGMRPALLVVPNFHGDALPTKLPPTTFIDCTTDFGKCHPALKRRFQAHHLKPASEAELLQYVLRRVSITESAARLINITG